MRRDPESDYAFYRFEDDLVQRGKNLKGLKLMGEAEEKLGVKCNFVRCGEMRICDVPGLSSHEEYPRKLADEMRDVCVFTTQSGDWKLICDLHLQYSGYYITDAPEDYAFEPFI